MRIAINAVAVDGGGSQTYLLSILKALRAISSHEFLVVLGAGQGSMLAALPPGVQAIVCRGVPRQAGLRTVWEQTALPVLLLRWNIDVLYAAFNTAVLLSPVPVVLLSHNCAPFSLEHLAWSPYGHARNKILRFLGRLSARVARTVVYVSHSSARVVAPQMKVPASRIRVIYHGWSPVPDGEGEDGRATWRLPDRYLLSVADLYPHKNLEVLMAAFQLLVAKGSYAGDLVIAGARKRSAWKYGGDLEALRDGLPCRDRIHLIGSIPHPALFAAYRAADLFLFPSLMESFALPLVESMGFGVPLIVSDWRLAPGGEQTRINVGPEICADAAEYFNPLDPQSFANAIERVLTNPHRRHELVQRGIARARDFSWERSAVELLRILEEAATRNKVDASAPPRPGGLS